MTSEEFELLAAQLWQSEPTLGFVREMYAVGAWLGGDPIVQVVAVPGDELSIPSVKAGHIGALSDGQRVLVLLANNRTYIVAAIP